MMIACLHLAFLHRNFEMGALAGSRAGSYCALQESRAALEAESRKVFTRKVVLLILMVMLLLPFVYARFFVSPITLLLASQSSPLPSSLRPSLPVKPAPANEQHSQAHQPQEQEEEEEDEEEDGDGEAEGENHIKLPDDHSRQERQDVQNLRMTQQQQEHVDLEDPTQLIDSSADDSAREIKDKQNGRMSKQQQERVELENPTQLIDSSINEDPIHLIDFSVGGCNIWKGKWIPYRSKPAYTNATCQFIQGHQNCMSNGRPDRKYLHWRWKPHDCELPLFDARRFLKLVRNKAWAFVGDSISRNHFQSFLCFLSQVELPRNMYNDEKDSFVRWLFPSYNFTLAAFWSPFLVQRIEDDAVKGFPSGTEMLHLDKVDKNWVSSLADFDYVVLAAGHWFFKSSVYFTNNELIGCHYCPGTNCTQLGFFYGLRTALRTVYDFLVSSNYQGIVFFRTFTPEHFENGQWYEGGNCMRTMPYLNATLSETAEQMYKIQLEEFGRTLQMHSGWKDRLKIVDTMHASLARADGHPGPYRSVGSSAKDLPQDCLHWCLPGPIDTWSTMLFEMIMHM